MTDVRSIAYEALLLSDETVSKHPATREILDRYSYLERLDRRFLKRLIEGTIERRITIDHVLDLYSNIPVRKMKKQIRTALRMGTYQLLYMEAVPAHAAVKETVGLVRKRGFASLSGFVNAVLRNIERNKHDLKYPDPETDPIGYMSVYYSCPEWIVQKLITEAGREKAESLLELSVTVRPVTARVNLSVSSVDSVMKRCSCTTSILPECAVVLSDIDDITSLEPFKDGSIFIQDISSMLVCIAADIKEDDTVIDLCAAPGGKALHAADIATFGRVMALDVSESKADKIRENIQRCGFTNITTRVGDATVYDESLRDLADVVIADVPCSGLGVIGRKNDIKYNMTSGSVDSLAALQKQILSNAVRYVRPGGILMFSTCTCSEAENIENFRFLTDDCKLEPVDFYDRLPEVLKNTTAREGYLQLYGEDALTDGFFIGKLRRHE